MHLTFVTFNYQSADLEAEERNYLGHHVELAKRFPGLRQYYTGRLMKVAGRNPIRFAPRFSLTTTRPLPHRRCDPRSCRR